MAESILNYTPEELADHFSSKGIEGYRAKQVFAWVCGKDKNDFQGMTNLPQEICRKLSKEFVITTLTCLEKAVSKKDQTEKFLWDLGDGCYVETVLIRAKARRTICLSTQAGCRFGCPFCASGKQGFKRNLSAGEIVDEVLSVQRMNKERITNVVFMGMGEPLDNYDNLEKAIKIINHPEGIDLGARKITISTCGIIPGIKKLAELHLQVGLSVSLHSCDNDVRNKLVPANRKYPLGELISACREYRKVSGRVVTVEYALMDGINDSPGDADKLAAAAKKIGAKVNLINCNSSPDAGFSPSSEDNVMKFRNILEKKGVTVTMRGSKGDDISAACGQLAGARINSDVKRNDPGLGKYKLVVFDIDGTITKHVSSWRYIHEKLGLWDILAKKYQEQFLAGKISYKKFCELDAAHWKGVSVKKLEDIFKKVQYSKNAETVIRKLKRQGFKLAAVSTGLQFITDRVKKELGFDYVLGNRLDTRGGILTGGVTINISHGAKGETLERILKKFNVKPEEMIAVGDTDGDIPMVRLAGYSIAFNSTSEELSAMVDHNCGSSDFMEVYDTIELANSVRGPMPVEKRTNRKKNIPRVLRAKKDHMAEKLSRERAPSGKGRKS